MLRLKTRPVYIAIGFGILLIVLALFKIQNHYARKNKIQLTKSDLVEFNKILEKTRRNIRHSLCQYNFSFSGVNNLEDLLMESNGRPIKNVIISTWRSGSTFFGDLLNAMPGGFHHFEPLIMYHNTQLRGSPNDRSMVDEATKAIKKMFGCDFSGEHKYLDYGLRDMVHIFKMNKRLWEICLKKEAFCGDTEMLSQICRLFPFQSMKLVRYRLRLANALLEDMELNVKVVLLVRDPRGVMQSRSRVTFCTEPDCNDPKLLCNDMISDYLAALQLLKDYSNRFMVLRFEDLVLNLNLTTDYLLKFLQLGSIEFFHDFIKNHTTRKDDNNYSTFRNSQDVPFKWKTVLSFDYVEKIQEACFEAMELWGYKLAHNATHMASRDFDPLDHKKLRFLGITTFK